MQANNPSQSQQSTLNIRQKDLQDLRACTDSYATKLGGCNPTRTTTVNGVIRPPPVPEPTQEFQRVYTRFTRVCVWAKNKPLENHPVTEGEEPKPIIALRPRHVVLYLRYLAVHRGHLSDDYYPTNPGGSYAGNADRDFFNKLRNSDPNFTFAGAQYLGECIRRHFGFARAPPAPRLRLASGQRTLTGFLTPGAGTPPPRTPGTPATPNTPGTPT